MQRIAILTMVHDVSSDLKTKLWRQTLASLVKFELPIYLFADHTTSKTALKWLHDTYPFIHVDAKAPDTEWEKCAYGFNQIDAEWIAICHQDDQWIQGKIKEQLKYITPKVAVIVTGYLQINHDDTMPIWKYATKHSQFGLIDCMPSTWLINKTLIKEIKRPFPSRVCTDLGILLFMNQLGPIVCIQNPYVVYQNHTENGWNTVSLTEIQEGRNQLAEYAKRCQIEIKYVWGSNH